jgi:hypothetical protein
MGIGPFTTYAPPNVYTQTITEPVVGQLLGGLRVPVLIGVGQETLTQTDIEMIRGSSSFADTPIFGEDPTGRWVVGGTATNPILGNQDGNRTQFRVRNYPIVDGEGFGRVTFDSSKVSVTVDGQQQVVGAVDGTNGIITLLVPPSPTAIVAVSYFFHRKDTRVTDDVSKQVTTIAAVLVAPKTESYVITTGTNDKLTVTVNDTTTVTITLTSGTRQAADVANDINSAAVVGLSASVHVDNQGLNHVQLVAQGNVLIGSGTANGVLGFNPGAGTFRNKSFRVFNGPIVDGSDGGITTTDPSKVTVLINNVQVIASAVDGRNQTVTLPAAPNPGSTVLITYFFNTFQDTFDYLPNNNIVTVGNVGISPGRRDFLNGPDFIIVNQGDQSIIQWGTAFQVAAGQTTGLVPFNGTQIVGLLVDNRIFGVQCDRFTDPVTSSVSETTFVLPLKPTTGNGRDTPLGTSLFQTITNGRIDLPTNRPDLVIVHVGKTWRDATARPPVTVLSVDSATNTFILQNPVPADYLAFATFWYNTISDDVFTFTVTAAGPSGIGKYTVTSQVQNKDLFGVRFGTKAALPQTVQFPSGVENVPDAIDFGGTPIAETVTVTFSTTLDPATHASFTNALPEPYDIYTASQIFGGVVIDGNPAFSVNLSTGFRAQLLSRPVSSPLALVFAATDRLVISVDGIVLAAIDVSAATTLAAVAADINAVVDADTQAHPDGSPTFLSTAPNALASVVTYGPQSILRIRGRNLKTSLNGLVSSVSILSPTTVGQTDASAKVGFLPNDSAFGSYSAINQPAEMIGTQFAPYNITAAVNDSFQISVDGNNIGTVLPNGVSVTLDSVVNAINDAYITVASPADIATFTADVIALANNIKAEFNVHIASTTYHLIADAVNPVTAANAVDLATAITLLNQEKTKFNGHLVEPGVHQLNDTVNTVTTANATDLKSAVGLAYALKTHYNSHLLQMGVHGYDDIVNIVTAPAAIDLATSEALANDIKVQLNAHYIMAGVHLINDVVNTITAANAVDLPTTITLANQEKAFFNAHQSQANVHVVNDTTNIVATPDAVDLATVETLLNALKAAYNLHRVQLEGIFHVHGTNDLVDTATASISQLVARAGQGIDASKLVLDSRINTPNSNISILSIGTANAVLGFTAGAIATRHQPTAGDIAGALNADAGFNALAVSYPIAAPGLGRFIEINSRSVGSTSTISFTSVASTAFITDTNVGITPGVSGAIGENAQSGFTVASSAGPLGSNGTGFPGQTYTDALTGLRFTVLPASAGDYANGGSFTLIVDSNFTADAAIPIRAVPGVELTVFNTNGMTIGTTGIVQTYQHKGAEPQVGDIYYTSYNFAKTDLSTALFQDLKRIQQNFGPPTPDFPLSLAARLALLNGSVLVGLKQVLKVPGTSQASVTSFTEAIDEQKKPISGSVQPDIITPLGTDPNIFTFLNQHCIFMSSPRQAGERIGIVGVASGTTPLGVQAIAKGLNSELMIVAYPDSFVITITDQFGNLTDQLVDGSFCAAALCGVLTTPSIDVATPLTRRPVIGFKKLGRVLDPTEANQVAVAGVSIIEATDNGLRVRHGLTTRPDTVITRTPSVTLTIQFVQQQIRKSLDPFIGAKFTGALIKQIERAVTGLFATMIDSQIVASVAGISAVTDPTDPTIMRLSAIYVPIFPLEYIVATLQIRIQS